MLFAILGHRAGLPALLAARTAWPRPLARHLPALYRALRTRWYFDELYDLVFVRGGKAFANALWVFDRNVVDGAVNGVASFYGWARRARCAASRPALSPITPSPSRSACSACLATC